MIPFKPILDRVICIKNPVEETRESGIVIPAMFDDQEEAEVAAVGPGKYRKDGTLEPMEIAVGDRILFNKYQVQEIEVLGQKYLALRQEDVRAVLNR
jgi:chaperonin GroES